MSETSAELLAVYVDGETKTGKGAASEAIAAALGEAGYHVYYDVAGDFFRRYTALVRQHMDLTETDPLLTGKLLLDAAKAVQATTKAYDSGLELGDLQRPIISQSVAVLSELPYVQHAGAKWWEMALRRAQEKHYEVLVVDGRNPRHRVSDASHETGIRIRPILDLFMTCEAGEAARRTLRLQGVTQPTTGQLAAARQKVELRRTQDRERSERPFVAPQSTLKFNPDGMSAAQAIDKSWQNHTGVELPMSIELDNTHYTEPEMLQAVRSLALAAVAYARMPKP